MSHRRCLALLAALTPGACSYTFDSDAPEITLSGYSVDVNAMPKIVVHSGDSMGFTKGADGSDWVVLSHGDFDGEDPGSIPLYRAEHLDPPAIEEILDGDSVVVLPNVIYSIKHGSPGTNVITVRQLGQSKPIGQFQVAVFEYDSDYQEGGAELRTSDGGESFVYWDGRSPWFDIYRADGSHHFSLRMDVTHFSSRVHSGYFLPDITFSPDGTWLVTAAGCDSRFCQNIDLWSATSSQSRALERDQGGELMFDHDGSALLQCDAQLGLVRIPIENVAPVVLDPAPCNYVVQSYPTPSGATALEYWVNDESAGSDAEGQPYNYLLKGVLADGSAPARLLPDTTPAGDAVLLNEPDGFAYRTDPIGTYVDDSASDGWIGQWQFMERGRDVQLSGDLTRVRWTEHTAHANEVGELLSADRATHDVLRIALNTAGYAELPDGRLVAYTDCAEKGPWNRVVVIDEQTRQARLLITDVSGFTPISGTNGIIVPTRVALSNANDVQWVKVPIPAR